MYWPIYLLRLTYTPLSIICGINYDMRSILQVSITLDFLSAYKIWVSLFTHICRKCFGEENDVRVPADNSGQKADGVWPLLSHQTVGCKVRKYSGPTSIFDLQLTYNLSPFFRVLWQVPQSSLINAIYGSSHWTTIYYGWGLVLDIEYIKMIQTKKGASNLVELIDTYQKVNWYM